MTYFACGIAIRAGWNSWETLHRLAIFSESRGFHSLWVTEDSFREEALASLGALAVTTNKIRLGAGVLNPFTRAPPLIGMAAVTLSRLSSGRFILGLGRGDDVIIQERLGLPYKKSFALLRECMMVTKELQREKLSKQRRIGRVSQVVGIDDLGVDHVPVWIGTGGTNGAIFAGKYSDGLILNVYSSVSYAAYVRDQFLTAAKAEGRRTADLTTAAFLPVFLSHSDNTANYASIKRSIATWLGRFSYGEMLLERSGVDKTVFRGIAYNIRRGRLDLAVEFISNETVKLLCAVGSHHDIERRIEDLRVAGVNVVVLVPRLQSFRAIARTLSPK